MREVAITNMVDFRSSILKKKMEALNVMILEKHFGNWKSTRERGASKVKKVEPQENLEYL